MDTIPTTMATIGRYISVCRKLSATTSGISGGDSSWISPLGSSGGSGRSVRRTMTVVTMLPFCMSLRAQRTARLDRLVRAERVIILRPYFAPVRRCAKVSSDIVKCGLRMPPKDPGAAGVTGFPGLIGEAR